METEFSGNATMSWRQHLESIDKNENIPPTSSERFAEILNQLLISSLLSLNDILLFWLVK